jgi:hypothetical protein
MLKLRTDTCSFEADSTEYILRTYVVPPCRRQFSVLGICGLAFNLPRQEFSAQA